MHRIKLITLDPSLKNWPSLPSKLSAIITELNTMRNADFSISVEHRSLVPHLKRGRITHEWMDSVSQPYLKRGYDFVAVHMSEAQKEEFGLQPSTLRGVYQVDFDLVHECYFWADEYTNREGYNQFIETFLHELRHGLNRGMKREDDTHPLHNRYKTLRGTFRRLDMTDYSPRDRNIEAQIMLLERAVRLLQIKLARTKPTIHTAAVKYLGTDASPRDLAPDALGCAESVSNVIRDVVPDFPIITGTWTLWDRLKKDKRFRQVHTPMPGTIIIAPTGTVRSNIPGHVGIFGPGKEIYSSNSDTGIFEQNYTLESWNQYYGDAGYTSYMFQLIR